MKKFLSLVLSMLICFSFVSCGADPESDNSSEYRSEIKDTSSAVSQSDGKYDSEDNLTNLDTDQNSHEEESSEVSETGEKTLIRELDLSNSDNKQVKKVTLSGEFSEDTRISDLYNINVLHTDLVGLFGSPIGISSADFESGTLVFEYDEKNLNNVPEENLILLYYDENETFYNTVSSKLDVDENKVEAQITQAGDYMLADAYVWYSVWGWDVSGYTPHDTVYTDSEFGFQITVPAEIELKYVSDFLKEDEEGMCQTLLECYSNENIQIGIEYLERPNYASAEDYVSTMAGVVESNSALVELGEIVTDSDETGYYFYADFGEIADTMCLSMNCIFPITDTQYINIWYGFTEKAYYETAIGSLKTFHWASKPDLQSLKENNNDNSLPEKALHIEDITLSFPKDVAVSVIDEPWEEYDGVYLSTIAEFDWTTYSEYVRFSTAAVAFMAMDVYVEANAMERVASTTNGLSFIKRNSVTLSNGCDGEILCVSADYEIEEYNAPNGLYYIYGWFETTQPNQRVNFTIGCDKSISQEKLDELYNFIMDIDVVE